MEELDGLDLPEQRHMALERLPAGFRSVAKQVVEVRGSVNMLPDYCT